MNSNAISETSTMAEKDLEKEDFGGVLETRQLSRILSEKDEQQADNRSVSSATDVPPENGGSPTNNDLERISTADYPKSYKLAFIVLALVCSIFLVSLDMTIVATAIPKITDAFHSLDQVGW